MPLLVVSDNARETGFLSIDDVRCHYKFRLWTLELCADLAKNEAHLNEAHLNEALRAVSVA
jgi:hypothetical protein